MVPNICAEFEPNRRSEHYHLLPGAAWFSYGHARKNNKEVVINQRQPLPSSAFERHQIALEKERESVQVNFVSCTIGTRSALTYHHYSVMIIVLFILRVHLL